MNNPALSPAPPTSRVDVDLEFEVCNVEQLIDACQTICNETSRQDSPVHPSEILTESLWFNRIWLTLSTQTLTDGSKVYNLEVR